MSGLPSAMADPYGDGRAPPKQQQQQTRLKLALDLLHGSDPSASISPATVLCHKVGFVVVEDLPFEDDHIGWVTCSSKCVVAMTSSPTCCCCCYYPTETKGCC